MSKNKVKWKPKLKCFFSHPYNTKGSLEEAEIVAELKARQVEVINPLEYVKEIKDFRFNISYKTIRDYWTKDLKNISECDMILIYVPEGTKLSGGCGIQMFHAYQLHKFIQIITDNPHPAIAWVLTGANQIYETIKDWKGFHQMRWS